MTLKSFLIREKRLKRYLKGIIGSTEDLFSGRELSSMFISKRQGTMAGKGQMSKNKGLECE